MYRRAAVLPTPGPVAGWPGVSSLRCWPGNWLTGASRCRPADHRRGGRGAVAV